MNRCNIILLFIKFSKNFSWNRHSRPLFYFNYILRQLINKFFIIIIRAFFRINIFIFSFQVIFRFTCRFSFFSRNIFISFENFILKLWNLRSQKFKLHSFTFIDWRSISKIFFDVLEHEINLLNIRIYWWFKLTGSFYSLF
jgi:hypothetical protein